MKFFNLAPTDEWSRPQLEAFKEGEKDRPCHGSVIQELIERGELA